MAPLTRFFPSPRGNEGSKAKANCGAGDERRRDQLQDVDAVHGSGISACSISFDNTQNRPIFPIEAADLRQSHERHARATPVTARHDRVIASYADLSELSRQVLNLPTQTCDPSVRYQQVRDSWFGVPNADGHLDLVGLFGERTTNGPSSREDRSPVNAVCSSKLTKGY